jgi:hypothetical protein
VAEAAAAAAGVPHHHHPPSPVRLTYLPFILRALSVALADFPAVNASLAPGRDDALALHADHNFGIAVDTPAGLAVPVVRRVQDRSLAGLAAEVARLSAAAAAGALRPDDIAGGTLTVSNIGAVGGGGHAAPLVHVPQAVILAVGRCVVFCFFFVVFWGRMGKRRPPAHNTLTHPLHPSKHTASARPSSPAPPRPPRRPRPTSCPCAGAPTTASWTAARSHGTRRPWRACWRSRAGCLGGRC